MTNRPKHMILNAFLSTNHNGSWRYPGGDAERHRFSFYKKVVQTAERGKMDMFFVADKLAVFDHEAMRTYTSYIRMEPFALLSALSAVTRHIGLAGTLSTTYNEPFHAARKLASLDHISGGRAAWNVVTSTNDEEGRNFGRESHLEHGKRYARADEFVEVVKGLWDSWEDDAFVVDKGTGVFADPDKLHVLNHVGEHFSVRGPLNAARPPQGNPVIVYAGASEACQEQAARNGDAVFVSPESPDEAKKLYASFKDRLAKYGRQAHDLNILPGVLVIVGQTEEEARSKSELLDSLIPEGLGLSRLQDLFGVDYSAYPLDEPLPKLADTLAPDQTNKRLLAKLIEAESSGLTVRGLYTDLMKASMWEIVGTPEQVADELQLRFESGMADGFNITSPYLPGGLDEFVDNVIPLLQQRGLFRTEYEGPTLRENLGLSRPANRYALSGGEKANG